MVKCPCGVIISFEPSQPDYKQKNEKGVDLSREAAEHMAKFRVRCSHCRKNFCAHCKREPYHIGMTCEEVAENETARKCRFCDDKISGNTFCALPCFKDVCTKADCRAEMKRVCTKLHDCGHPCGGFAHEPECLPCLEDPCREQHNARAVAKLKVPNDCGADDYCHICFTEALKVKASVQLECSHVFHVECIIKKIKTRWFSPRIVFGFLNCPECQTKVAAPHHPWLKQELGELRAFETLVRRKALERAKFEDIDKDPRLKDPTDHYYNNLQDFAMYKLAYYQCFQCKDAYFGGKKDCIAAQMEEQEYKPEELVCGKCAASAVGGGKGCKTHGIEFNEFKCKFCCSVAQWFCWGTTHFCEDCHKRQCKGDYVSKYKVKDLP